MNTVRAVDAFCGAGGLSLGLSQAGFDVIFGFDLDEACIRTLKGNPHRIQHPVAVADVRKMLDGRLMEVTGLRRGELELLAGGPPCQGFSVQRTVGADHDDRNLLVHDYGDLVLEVFPKFFLLENVPGLGGKRGRALVEQFRERMSTGGYLLHERTVDAQHHRVPQRRRRLIMIGERSTSGISSFRWPENDGTPPPTVREAIGNLPPPPKDGTPHPDVANHRADRLTEINRKRLDALKPGQGRIHLPTHLMAECHLVDAKIIGHRNVYGRMDWEDVAPTITARFDSFTRGKFGHPEQTRTISLREGAILQTFPDDYIFIGSKVEVARQIGNAVPPLLAKALGSSILRALNVTNCSGTV